MLKVTKFGGSSMADAGQYRKVRDIILADPDRRVVIVSAAGKRNKNDHKITDLLYLCHSHVKYGVDCDRIFQMIASRYIGIRNELGLALAIEPELEALKKAVDAKQVTREELVSRGEYFSAKLMAAYLGFPFIDAADWVKFNFDGTVDQEASYEALRNRVTPGAGAVILFTILSGVGFTGEAAMMGYALILAINRPIEMLVTSLNCVGDSVAAIAVAKSENKFDEDVFNA